MNKNFDFSIVIPAYLSEKFLNTFITELLSYTDQSKFSYEILIIVDGSPDKTWEEALKITQKNNFVRAIKLLKNYGQHTANLCGFRYSQGKYVITMDDDGQNPPSELKHFEQFYDSDYDLIIGELNSKKHSLYRKLGSYIIGNLNRKIFNITNKLVLSNYRMIRRDVIERINNDNSPTPYIPGMCLKYSNNQINVKVNHRERINGRSNYSLIKLIRLVFELLIQHSYIPLKFVAYVGALMSSLGMFGAFYIFFQWLYGDVAQVDGWSSIITILLISSGMLMASISILGLYIIRVIQNQSSFQYIETSKSWIE